VKSKSFLVDLNTTNYHLSSTTGTKFIRKENVDIITQQKELDEREYETDI
jgi:hypothetical protein